MERIPVDDDFSLMGDRVMALLAQERSRKNVSELLALLNPILDYYIRFYMYRFGVYDSHPDRGDVYGETYVRCVDLLGQIKLEGIVPRGDYSGQVSGGRAKERVPIGDGWGTANFSRIKRYINKSVAGWVYNRVFKKRKRDVELTHNDMAALVFPDPEDRYGEVDTAADIESIEGHLKRQTPLYVELHNSLFGSGADRDSAARRFRSAVYAGYSRRGALPSADDVFATRFGGVFE